MRRDGTPCIDVRSPVAGHVLRVLEESERIVAAGTPLLEIGDPSDLEIVVDVLSTDAVRIRPGARDARSRTGAASSRSRARVRRVEPSGFTKVSALGVEEQRVNVIGDFVDRPRRLGDGYRVEARIVVWEAPDVVRVPGQRALPPRRTAGTSSSSRAAARASAPCEVGHRGTFEAEVRSGLEPGEHVILHPSDRVQDGTRVRAL